MRALRVDKTESFTRGGDPYAKLSIGNAAKIKEILDNPNYRLAQYGTYEITSADHIIISLMNLITYVVRYVERTRFEAISHTGGVAVKEFSINMRGILTGIFPGGFDVKTKFYNLPAGEAEIITDALNKYYGPIGGFEPTEIHPQ